MDGSSGGFDKRVWTPERVSALTEMWPTTLAVNAITAQLGVTNKAAWRKAYRLGLRRGRGPGRISWTPYLVALLTELWPTNKAIDTIASEIGISQASARAKANVLGLQRPVRSPYRHPAQKTPRTQWTPEKIAELVSLWASNLSGTEIATKMGITKNTVCGKARRMGLPMRNPSKDTRSLQAKLQRRRLPRQESRCASVLSIEDWSKPGHCLYPIGAHVSDPDFHFCGNEVARPGAPYCDFHLAIAYVPAKKKSDRPAKIINWKGPMQ